jgi:hypothetical protein
MAQVVAVKATVDVSGSMQVKQAPGRNCHALKYERTHNAGMVGHEVNRGQTGCVFI